MGAVERELYNSANGDNWRLVRHPETGDPVVQHTPNAPSGGQISFTEIGTFLASGAHAPERRALLRLIATLLEEHSFEAERSSASEGPDRKHHNEDGGYEVDELAQRHGISNDQASRLMRQVGQDRDKLDAEAEKLTKR